MGFSGDDSNGRIFAEGDLDNLSDFERQFRFVSEKVFALMERFSGRNQIVVHKISIPEIVVYILQKSMLCFLQPLLKIESSTKEVNVRRFRDESGAA